MAVERLAFEAWLQSLVSLVQLKIYSEFYVFCEDFLYFKTGGAIPDYVKVSVIVLVDNSQKLAI